METLKFSLNALVSLCCLAWLMTSCQDDVVENDLLASEENNAEQALVPDDVRQLLQSVAESSPLPAANPGARTSRPFAFEYDFSLTVSELIRPDQPGDELQDLNGTLTLWEVDSTDLINPIVGGGAEFQLYQGGYVAVNAEGDTIRRRAAAFSLEESDEAFLFIRNVPGAGEVIAGGNFRIMDSSGGRAFDRDGGDTFVTFESDFLHDEEPEEEDSSFVASAYDLLVTVQERVVAERDTLDSPAGPIPVVRTRLDTLVQLDGVLALEETDDPFLTGRFEGTFTYTTSAGVQGSAPVKGLFDPNDSENRSVILTIEPIADVDEVNEVFFFLPVGETEFSTVANGRDNDGSILSNITVVGSVASDPS